MEPDVAPAPVVFVSTGEDIRRRSSWLLLKEPQFYDPIGVRAAKLRGLKDALIGCTATLQKHVCKHAVLADSGVPLRKRAVAALASSICVSVSSVPAASDD
jgi:hypothetical protein